ncbi:alpha/beta-hydrolase [Pleomassaria siparia CBS 279.74]|uniref:Carboxylic ester hydrolase n=1 Tax=Pleomassaria siparia CBS 279.74 TaxID=1314801 RepID=A0A6G1KRL8_9PLEO|nr:alpha/beta-hydrolase [Pleomassaria siparia CBS 279.74]
MVVLNWGSLSLCVGTALAAPYRPYSHRSASPPTVNVLNGTLEGVYSAEYNQDYFLGVPFAQPPIGLNRFRVPQSLDTRWTTPRPAKHYSAACVGSGSGDLYPVSSEDCLYLNVIRPSGYENASLPVGFWIHGGGLTSGSAIDERYNASFIVQRSVEIGKPIIAVTVNYRLSMWGFLTGDEVVENGIANLGLRDQRRALEWLQENVAAFGGDPSKVTIWGESAGGLSVGMQLTAYGGRDDSLFRSAIMESGNPIYYYTFDYNTDNFFNASSQLGCGNSTSKLDCLRAIPFSTLSSWISSEAGQGLQWGPIIDNDFIQGKTSLQLDKGEFVQVPIICGANSDEGTGIGPTPMNTTAQFTEMLEGVNGFGIKFTPTQVSRILAAYPSNLTYGAVPTAQPLSYVPGPAMGAESRRSGAFFGDIYQVAPRRKTCQTWTKFNIPAYCYRFNTIPHGISAAIGATHFQEVAFVFNNQLGLGYAANPFGDEPQSYFDLGDTMSENWVRFINDGAPRDEWPTYHEGQNWVFDANVTGLGYVEKDDWRTEGIELLNGWDADVLHR